MAKLHYPHPDPQDGPASMSLCGWLAVEVTTDKGALTCKACLRALLKAASAGEASAPGFTPGEVYEGPPGASVMEPTSLLALERSLRGYEEARYPWRSAQEALRELAAFRADGQGIGSTSNPSRFEKAPRGRDDPMRQATAQVDRIRGVDAARARAYPTSRAFAWTICECGAETVCTDHNPKVVSVSLTVAMQVQLLDWSVELRRVPGDPKPVALSLETIMQRAADAWGIRLTERQVTLVRGAGLRAVSAHLRSIGEMAPPKKEAGKESDVAVRGYDLSGWDEIEEHAGMSRSVMRRLSERENDPFPIHEVEGVRGYHARKADIDEWVERNSSQRKAVGA